MVWSEREPKLKRMMAGIQRRVKESATGPYHIYEDGMYPFAKRASLDQVPCMFGLNGRETLDSVGSDRVQIFTGKGDADQKRMCTLQICVLNLGPGGVARQPRPCIIFRGKGGAYYDKERKLYDKRVDVLFQPKAWADRPTSLAYVRESLAKTFRKDADGRRHLLFCDNLDSQKTQKFKDALRRVGADVHFGVACLTDDWQVVDNGVGKAIKSQMAEELDEMQESMSNEELAKMTAMDRRVMVTKAYGSAYYKVLGGEVGTLSLPKIFDQLGASMGKGGPRRMGHPIKFQGSKSIRGYEFEFELSDAAPRAVAPAAEGNPHDDDDEPLAAAEPAAAADGPAAKRRRVVTKEEGEHFIMDILGSDGSDSSGDEGGDADASDPEEMYLMSGEDSSDEDAEDDPPAAYPDELRGQWCPAGAMGDPRGALRVGSHIAHNFVTGWEIGKIIGVAASGKFHVRYRDDDGNDEDWTQPLSEEGYGAAKENLWVIVNEN